MPPSTSPASSTCKFGVCIRLYSGVRDGWGRRALRSPPPVFPWVRSKKDPKQVLSLLSQRVLVESESRCFVTTLCPCSVYTFHYRNVAERSMPYSCQDPWREISKRNSVAGWFDGNALGDRNSNSFALHLAFLPTAWSAARAVKKSSFQKASSRINLLENRVYAPWLAQPRPSGPHAAVAAKLEVCAVKMVTLYLIGSRGCPIFE